MRFSPGLSASLAVLLSVLLPACEWMPGRPRKADEVVAPTAVMDFSKLFTQNCVGCHGAGGNISGSFALDDPTYLAIVPEEKLRAVITGGVPGSLMPPFSIAHGGMLTDDQITVLVQGISAWKTPAANSSALPPYSAPPGQAAAGAQVYETYLASLRKMAGDAMIADGVLANRAFLGLTSDQYLRTLILIGRPELGIPNFERAIPGQPLSNEQIADMVAWLISQRKNEFGQPLVPVPQ